MERRSLLPCLYTHEWRSNGKKRFLALGERSGKAGDTHAHKIGSASPRLPSIGYFENVDSIDGFWSVEEEGIWYAWKGVRGYACYFVETDLFRGCLTLKWYAPGIQKGEGRRGEGRRCLLVRRKKESGASTCIFHSFAILSIEEYVEERRERGRERGSGPSSSTTPFSSSIATERMLASFLSSRFQKELTTWKLKPLPLPALTFVRHFSSGTLARQSYSPFRHYVHPASVPFLQSGRVI